MMSRQPEKTMNTPFVEIATIEALDDFVTKANGSAALLFKHSNLCGVSSRAYSEMSTLNSPVGLVVVQKARSVSDEIARRWGIGHETPQVLIVRGDEVVWNASHFEIKNAAVSAAVAAAGGEG
jgi:bacillithiol system protein YtxJ